MNSSHGDYDTLIQPIEDRMIRTVWRIVRDPDDADDAFQEALETIWRRLDHVARHPNPHALILRICINCAYDVLRRKSRRERHIALAEISDEMPASAPSAAEQVASRETREEIYRAIGQLPGKQAEAVLMRFVEDMPYGDIAQALGCREATARKHIARARVKLATALAHLAPSPLREVANHEAY